MAPSDETEFSAYSVLHDNPPSQEFHEQLWAWFASRLKEFHASKR
jgi:hypothetical protein